MYNNAKGTHVSIFQHNLEVERQMMRSEQQMKVLTGATHWSGENKREGLGKYQQDMRHFTN